MKGKRAARQAASPSTPVTVAQLLTEHTPRVRRLAESLRTLIKETLPDASEIAYPVWHVIGYRHSEAGYVCAIFPQRDGVKLGFEHGVKLDDPEQLLDSGGRQVRYLTVKGTRDIRVGAIRRMLREAVRMQSIARYARQKIRKRS